MKHLRNEIGKWVINWEGDLEKGVAIDTKNDKQYSFSKNFALTHPVPQKVIEVALKMVKDSIV